MQACQACPTATRRGAHLDRHQVGAAIVVIARHVQAHVEEVLVDLQRHSVGSGQDGLPSDCHMQNFIALPMADTKPTTLPAHSWT